MWVVMDQEASERKCDLSSLYFAVNKQTLRNALLDPGGDFFSTNTTKLSSFPPRQRRVRGVVSRRWAVLSPSLYLYLSGTVCFL